MNTAEAATEPIAQPVFKGTCFLCGQASESNAEPCKECLTKSEDGLGFLAEVAYGLSTRAKLLQSQLDVVKAMMKSRIDKGQTEYANGYKVQRMSFQTTRFDAKLFEKERPADYKHYLRTSETDSLRIDPAPGFS